MTNAKSYSGRNLWGIHGGRTGDADSIFLKHGHVALGWARLGDLSKIPANRDAFKNRLKEAYPDEKPGKYAIDTGQLFRFVHEMKDGDLVAYPSKIDKRIHLGEISGPYKYIEKGADGYPHRRPVKWLKDFPRTKFTQGALYEIGSAMSFFQVKNYAEEYIAAVTGDSAPPHAHQDETVKYVAEDIEQNTRDFVLKTLSQEFTHVIIRFEPALDGEISVSLTQCDIRYLRCVKEILDYFIFLIRFDFKENIHCG